MSTDATAASLRSLLDAAGVGGSESLTSRDVERIWATVAPAQPSSDFLQAVVAACHPEWDADASVRPDQLGLRVGRWRLDLTRQVVRAGLLTAVAAAVLGEHGFADLGVVFTTAILPAVFDVERVELSAGDGRLLVELRAHEAFSQGFATVDELYESLPQATRDMVNRFDFADFVQRVRDSGLLDEAEGGTIRLRSEQEHRPHLGP